MLNNSKKAIAQKALVSSKFSTKKIVVPIVVPGTAAMKPTVPV
jgi:hypothetical protein